MANSQWRSQQPTSNLFATFLLALAVACVRSVFAGGRTGAVVAALGSAVLLTLTAVAFLRRARGFRLLAGVTGSLLLLYSVSLAVFGMEDVGGPRVAIPLAIALAAFGVWGLVLASRTRKNEAA
jgi:hypothetical protein